MRAPAAGRRAALDRETFDGRGAPQQTCERPDLEVPNAARFGRLANLFPYVGLSKTLGSHPVFELGNDGGKEGFARAFESQRQHAFAALAGLCAGDARVGD